MRCNRWPAWRPASIVLFLLIPVSGGCVASPATPASGGRRLPKGPPDPQDLSELREGMPLPDALQILTDSAWPVIRSAFSDQDIEMWCVSPRDTYTLYHVLFRRGVLDCVIPETDPAGGNNFDNAFAVPDLPPLPQAGGEAVIAQRLHSRGRPIESIDFGAVNRGRAIGQSQVDGMRLALGFFNPTLWFSDESKAAWRDYNRAIKSVAVGMSREQTLAALGTPTDSSNAGTVEYLLFERSSGWSLKVGLRDGIVRAIYGSDQFWAGDAHAWSTEPVRSSRSAPTSASPAQSSPR